MRYLHLLSIFYLLSFAAVGAAATQMSFYVSPTGNDNNSGTISAPFKTIERAQDAIRKMNSSMTGNIIVYLREGMYSLDSTLTFKKSDSGANGFRIIYKAYQSEKPVISGGKKLAADWTQHSGNIYKTKFDYDKKLRSLYVNGHYRTMAEGEFIQGRGGSGTFKITGNEPWAITSGSCAAGIKFDKSDFGDYINPQDIELISDTSNPYLWNLQRICIETIQTSDSFRIAQIQQPGFAFPQSLAWNVEMEPKKNVLMAFHLARELRRLNNPSGMEYIFY